MPTLGDIRSQYPQYSDMDDATLAAALHKKFYADIPREVFDEKIGFNPARTKAEADVARDRAEPSMVRTIGEGFRSVANGIGMGYADEIQAALEGGLNTITGGYLGQPYEDALEYQRAYDRAVAKDQGGLGTVLQLGGALATAPLLPGTAAAATAAGNVAKGAAVGSGYGALSGFGAGEGSVANRLDAAGTGAMVGGALGAAAPVVIQGAVAAGSRAADAIAGTNFGRLLGGSTADAADRILANTIARGGSTPQAVADELAKGQYSRRLHSNSEAALPETIMDVTDATQRLGGSVYRAGGDGATLVRETLERRQKGPENPYAPAVAGQPRGQAEDIIDATDRALTVDSLGTALQNERAIIAKQKADGAVLYAEARKTSEPFDLKPVVYDFIRASQDYPGSFGATMRRAAGYFSRNGKYVDDVARFDNAKKAIDDLIDRAQRTGSNNLVRELTGFKNALLDAVHAPNKNGAPTRNVKYAEARATWGTAAEQREAIELGRAALRDASEVTVEQYRALTPFQQSLFRIGLAQGVRNALATKRPGNDVTMLFQQRRVQELLREVIPTPKKANAVFADRPQRFGDLMRRYERMNQTRNRVLGGSQTAERLADDATLAADAVEQTFRGLRNMGNFGLELVMAGASRLFGMRRDVASALAKRLVESDPAEQQAILQRLNATYGPDRVGRFVTGVRGGALRFGTAAATTAGSMGAE